MTGYPFWRAISTGKPPSLGGIPHDTYGMTTRSVHRYVVNTLERMGLEEEQMSKIQTGGPDGDLGRCMYDMHYAHTAVGVSQSRVC